MSMKKKNVSSLLKKIFLSLENIDYGNTLPLLSKLVGENVLKPLLRIVNERKRELEIMKEINTGRKKDDENRFRRREETFSRDNLTREELLWYRTSFNEDFGRDYCDFRFLEELIKKYSEEIGRTKIIQMYFFGEYFGVNEVKNTTTEFYRRGLGLVIEKEKRILFSTNFVNNHPSTTNYFLYFSPEDGLRYFDQKDFKFYHFTKGEQEVKVVFDKAKLEEIQKRPGSKISDYINEIFSTGAGPLFPSLNNLDTKKVLEKNLMPLNLLQFFTFRKRSYEEYWNAASLLVYFCALKDKEVIRALTDIFPEIVTESIPDWEPKCNSQEPLVYKVLTLGDIDFLEFFFLNLEKSSQILLESLRELKSEFHDREDDNTSKSPFLFTFLRFYERLENEEDKVRFRKLLSHISKYLGWEIPQTFYLGNNRVTRKEFFIEKVIKNDNLKLAKFLLEELPKEKGSGNYNMTIDNILHLDDILLTGEANSNDPRFRRFLMSGGSQLNKKNETYNYVHKKRSELLCLPQYHSSFPQEHKHVLRLFLWILNKKQLFLPPEMIQMIFGFIDFFDFDYILGKKYNVNDGHVSLLYYLWNDPLPNFNEMNSKLYIRQVEQIKDIAKSCFFDTRDKTGEIEFKSLIEFCLSQFMLLEKCLIRENNNKDPKEENKTKPNKEFYKIFKHLVIKGALTKSKKNKEWSFDSSSCNNLYSRSKSGGLSTYDKVYHFGLIKVVHLIKKEIFHRENKEEKKGGGEQDQLSMMISDFVELIEKEKTKQLKWIKSIRESIQREKGSWRRGPYIMRHCDWMGKKKSLKYFDNLPADQVKKENSVSLRDSLRRFFLGVRNLR